MKEFATRSLAAAPPAAGSGTPLAIGAINVHGPVQGNADGAFVSLGRSARTETRMSIDRGPRQVFNVFVVDHPHSRRRRLGRLLVLILVAGLVTIVPLAYASPADPAWIAGIYDTADYDDVVSMLTEMNGTGAAEWHRPVEPSPAVDAEYTGAAVPASGVLLGSRLRSPPDRAQSRLLSSSVSSLLDLEPSLTTTSPLRNPGRKNSLAWESKASDVSGSTFASSNQRGRHRARRVARNRDHPGR